MFRIARGRSRRSPAKDYIMKKFPSGLLIVLGVVLLGAAHPSPMPSGYTVPLVEPGSSQPRGTVEVTPHANQTLLRVTMFNSSSLKPALTLHLGTDCYDDVLA